MNSSDQGDLLQAKGNSASSADVELLKQQFQVLRTLFHAALVALVLLGLGVDLFLYKQMRIVRAQLEEQRRYVVAYKKTSEPLMNEFAKQLQGFANANRDFQPILERYRPFLSSYFAPPVPSSVQPVKPPQK